MHGLLEQDLFFAPVSYQFHAFLTHNPISTTGFLAPFTFEGWTNKEAFLTYVTQVLVPELWAGAGVVMDNLPAEHRHKSSRSY